jgi:hypothetical protein
MTGEASLATDVPGRTSPALSGRAPAAARRASPPNLLRRPAPRSAPALWLLPTPTIRASAQSLIPPVKPAPEFLPNLCLWGWRPISGVYVAYALVQVRGILGAARSHGPRGRPDERFPQWLWLRGPGG